MYMNDGNKTKINLRNKSVFITGVAGFIGSNLAKRLLSTVEGVKVVGLDNMNHYYDVRLKEARLNELEQFDNFSFVKGNLADKAVIESIFEQYKPEIVVNLGAQAGVRYSITNPDAYVEANLIGFYNILEACRHSYDEGHTPVEHLVYASSSSVYGSNKKVPYSTDDKVDNPVSLYAATKKSNELMAHAYSKLYNIPSTGLRFFTVYGPAGRPDMAYFGFTNKLLKGETIQIFNYGNCKRDFTYVDLVFRHLIDFLTVQHQVGCKSIRLIKTDLLICNRQRFIQRVQVHKNLMLQIMPQSVPADHLLCLRIKMTVDKYQWLIKVE